MSWEESRFMPYAPVEPVMRVIRRLRERGLPDPLTRKSLPTLGIAEGNADRVEKALGFLGLIDAEGHRTQTFDRLGKASTDEYQPILAEVIRAAYAPILAIVDPTSDTDVAINDAFRPYEPSGQRARMVSLFTGLCKEAGIVEGGPVTRMPKAKRGQQGKTPPRIWLDQPTAAGSSGRRDQDDPVSGPDLRLLSALIQQLPKETRWTRVRREKWIQAVTATVDLLYEVEGNGPTP
jgi:hypothetical protein